MIHIAWTQLSMKRTQLQLDDDIYQVLWTQAYAEGVSIAGLVRKILRQQLFEAPERSRKLRDFSFIASGRSEMTDFDPISERHDEALAQDFSH